jgi:nucleotide-binding universal stress UspA family protein
MRIEITMNFFERILVPVDFSINTEVAVKKAIQLATPGSTTLYLFHVKSSTLSIDGVAALLGTQQDTAGDRLMEWEKYIRAVQPGLEVNTTLAAPGNIQDSLIAFAGKIKASLIIIGKNSRHSILPFLNTVISSTIAEATSCPVLTVKPGSMQQGVNTIVMLVTDFFPTRKIDLLSALNSTVPLNVHLLSILDAGQVCNEQTASALLNCMRSIRNRFKCNVQHSLIHSNNKAIAALRYAEKINADMLLLNPETESSINTWMSKKDITDVLGPASQLQVLSVQPHFKIKM